MTNSHPLAALIAGVPRYNGWNDYNPAPVLYESDILAALEAAPVPDLVEAGKANIAGLLEASRQLAGYASYAEIVGGVSVNRPQIRQWCDAVFEAVRTMPIDAESGERTAPDIRALIALATAQAAQIEGLTKERDDAVIKRAAWELSARQMEVERDTLRTEVERLRGQVKALCDAVEADDGSDHHYFTISGLAKALRDALEGKA